MLQTVTRQPGGITNSGPGALLEDLKMPDLSFYHYMFDDFDTFTATDWVITETDAGATQALTPGDGGLLLLQNTAGIADVNTIQWGPGGSAVAPTFLFEANKDVVFAARVALDDASLAGFLMGLAIADTSPIASLPATGMFISKPSGSVYPQGVLRSAGTGTLTAQSTTPMVSATMIDLAIVYTAAAGICTLYVGGATAFAPSAQFRLPAPLTLPAALIAPIFAVNSSTAVARSLTIDWYFAAKSRRPG